MQSRNDGLSFIRVASLRTGVPSDRLRLRRDMRADTHRRTVASRVRRVQSDTTQFLAFFIYGADGKATWYAAQLANDGTGNYTLGGHRSRNAGV
jgi:hypothetical protein